MALPINKAIPVQASERIQVVDVLRGFALLGVLLMNMRSFSGQPFGAGSWTEALDRDIINLLDFFMQAKFYSLFSFLFGWGIAKQMERAQAKNIRFIPLYMRRLVILFVFGGLHAIFLWTGDILTMYALLGLVLLLLFSKRWKNPADRLCPFAAGHHRDDAAGPNDERCPRVVPEHGGLPAPR